MNGLYLYIPVLSIAKRKKVTACLKIVHFAHKSVRRSNTRTPKKGILTILSLLGRKGEVKMEKSSDFSKVFVDFFAKVRIISQVWTLKKNV